jgi:hypothetical protein
LGVFEDRELRRIFGPTRVNVSGGSRRLHIKELHNLYDSPNVIRVIKSRRIRWGRSFSMYRRDKKCVQKFLSGSLKGTEHLEDLCIDGRIILEWILEK